ncbi:MAG: hypothetical protein V1859_05740 [archaeon]
MKQNIILFLLILLIPMVFSLDCQYTKDIVISTETKFLPFDNYGNELKEVTLEFSTINDGYGAPLKIINRNDVDILINLNININIKKAQWCTEYSPGLNSMRSFEILVPKASFIDLDVIKTTESKWCRDFRFTEQYDIQYKETDGVKVKPTDIKEYQTICDGGKNDGESCNSPNECGGGFCIEGYCSNSIICFNKDCKCTADEIQCDDNKRCVKNGVIQLDNKPKCNLPDECQTGYISNDTGLCAKSPAQLENEKRLQLAQLENEKREQTKFYLISGISIIFLLIIGFFIYLFYTNNSKKLDIQKIEAELKKNRYDIEQKNIEIDELKSKEHKTKEESNRLS